MEQQQTLFVDDENNRPALAFGPREKEQIVELMAQVIAAVQKARKEVADDVVTSEG